MAEGHVLALEKLNKFMIYNLGTGQGYSVLDVINTFEEATGKKIKYKFAPRRSGDVASYFADVSKAEKELGFKANKTLKDMCKDSWNYIKNKQIEENNGYSK